MKFRVEHDAWAEAVAWVARSLPTRPSVPVLAGLLVRADDGGLTLSGFDYETSTRATVPAQVAEEGTALVSGRLLAEIARALPNDTIDVTADAGRLGLTCRSSRFALQTLPIEEYPELPQLPATCGSVPAELFAAAVGQVAAAAGRDDMLPVLTGVRIEITGERVVLAATDRYRLAVRELTWSPAQPDAEAGALVPARVLVEAARSFAAESRIELALTTDGPAGRGTGDGLIGFSGDGPGGSRQTTTRLLDGEFPKYQTLFPSTRERAVVADTAALIESIKRVALVAERNTPIRISFEAGTATLEAGTSEEAQASEALPVELSGEPLTAGFNAQYLLDGLGAISTPRMQFAFTQPAKPTVLTGVSDDGTPSPEFRYLLMPVRLQG